MDATNVVVLRGTITSEPRRRELPSGSVVTQLEITTRSEQLTASVPVVVQERVVVAGAGDEVVVTGYVRRRFFQAGGVTQSRTEVVAANVLRATRLRSVERAMIAVARAVAP